MKVARLSALRTGRLYSPGDSLVPTSVRGWVDPRVIVRPEGLSPWIIPTTRSGIETAIIQLEEHCLNQRRYRYPILLHIVWHTDWLNNQLTNSTEQSPPWEASSSSAGQEIPRILSKRKVHYRVHKSLSLVPVLSEINLVHVLPSSFNNDPFKTILPSTHRSRKCSLSLSALSTYQYVFLVPAYNVVKRPQKKKKYTRPGKASVEFKSFRWW
jgi:hypothetical protein